MKILGMILLGVVIGVTYAIFLKSIFRVADRLAKRYVKEGER